MRGILAKTQSWQPLKLPSKMMREHPLLCTTSVVQAILGGRQTQDRRPITKTNSRINRIGKWANLEWEGKSIHSEEGIAPLPRVSNYLTDRLLVPYDWAKTGEIWTVYPRWEVGDRLWLREQFGVTSGGVLYADKVFISKYTDHGLETEEWLKKYGLGRLFPAIFMPRWAARLILEITAIRAGRIQDITEAEAKAEGMSFNEEYYQFGRDYGAETYSELFKRFWDSIYRKKGFGWAVNPWVWITDFRKLEAK